MFGRSLFYHAVPKFRFKYPQPYPRRYFTQMMKEKKRTEIKNITDRDINDNHNNPGLLVALLEVNGVGPKRANTIIEGLGKNAHEILKIAQQKWESAKEEKTKEDIVDSLKQITGIKEKLLFKGILDTLNLEPKEKIDEFMAQNGIPLDSRHGIRQKALTLDIPWKQLKLHLNNPYQGLYYNKLVTLLNADMIASYKGQSMEHPNRIEAYIYDQLSQSLATYEDTFKIAQQIQLKTSFSAGDVLSYISNGLPQDIFGYKNEKSIFLKSVYEQEKLCSSVILQLIQSPVDPVSMEEISKLLTSEKYKELTKGQISAIKQVFLSNLTIITGEAGTGKSTLIKHIVTFINKFFPNYKCDVVAYAGKAVRRIKEQTGISAQTIHSRFGGKRQKKTNVLIVDECSMIGLEVWDLIYKNLYMNDSCHKLIMIGDTNQLEPIGKGHVFWDLSQNLPNYTVRLDRVMRQKNSENYGILENARRVIDQIPPETSSGKDFQVIYAPPPWDNIVKEIAQKWHTEGTNSSWHNAVMLTPKNDRKFQVNPLCQNIWNKLGKSVTINKKEREVTTTPQEKVLRKERRHPKPHLIEAKVGTELKVGDRIIWVNNNYQFSPPIYNGTIGYIEGFQEKNQQPTFKPKKNSNILFTDTKSGKQYNFCTIKFEDREESLIIDSQSYFYNAELAYALTIHKSQGSEFSKVLILLENSNFETQNMVYTGITRATQECVLIAPSKEDVLKIIQRKIDYKLVKTHLPELLIKGKK